MTTRSGQNTVVIMSVMSNTLGKLQGAPEKIKKKAY